ncbi:uncharacterized protein [Nicotiana sylvestris]|uniref:uncharacterized protein n=1 Tax=Nicotiana sylvestris TaxID=4096 RepID=UPI00388C5F4E
MYVVHCEVYTNHRSLQHLFKQKDLNLQQQRWLEVLKDYSITILYHMIKANVVVDTLSRKAKSMGSLAYLLIVKRPSAMDVQDLANQFVILDDLEIIHVLSYVVSQPSLLEHIRAHHFDDLHLLVLKDTVQRGGTEEVVIGDDDVIQLQGRICIPNVDGLRDLILE